jgi:hypothetical protein
VVDRLDSGTTEDADKAEARGMKNPEGRRRTTRQREEATPARTVKSSQT